MFATEDWWDGGLDIEAEARVSLGHLPFGSRSRYLPESIRKIEEVGCYVCKAEEHVYLSSPLTQPGSGSL